ncbi:DUF3108 domain-containing protein [Paraflavitalea sp. CAU 1676]|uniref:DUF3108 domain-containing protein n=1 Tax=Paraflavitalea sp. CAU 1676 TaxID=3032598 RepID=UPI0023DC91D7|nr:DUF3108 domain-containing protein [Paraflavitalea sp. CAU 1676]MDF2187362.1 DUF3108 domain-containing protein [Paraflavitalea sp. CAU 1676]
MKRFRFLGLFALIGISFPIQAGSGSGNGFCDIKNTAFQASETLTYKVFYTVVGAYFGAGEATFSSKIERLNNKPVYHIIGEGKTYSFYDGIFKVRDKYETYVDTATFQPYRFVRNVNEGTYKKYEQVEFNKTTNAAVTNDGVYKVPECVQDVLSAIYYARNIEWDKYKTGDKITFSLFLDKEVFEMYIRYLGKETVKTKYGKFRAIKFKPLLIKGTIFEGGEKMTVWVSDDKNHIPLRVESPISVGSVKVDMISYRNLRHTLSSLIDVR